MTVVTRCETSRNVKFGSRAREYRGNTMSQIRLSLCAGENESNHAVCGAHIQSFQPIVLISHPWKETSAPAGNPLQYTKSTNSTFTFTTALFEAKK